MLTPPSLDQTAGYEWRGAAAEASRSGRFGIILRHPRGATALFYHQLRGPSSRASAMPRLDGHFAAPQSPPEACDTVIACVPRGAVRRSPSRGTTHGPRTPGSSRGGVSDAPNRRHLATCRDTCGHQARKISSTLVTREVGLEFFSGRWCCRP